MTGELSLEREAPLVPLRGEVRRLPPGPVLRFLLAVTLVTLLRSIGRAVLRYTLGYRVRFALYPKAREFILERERVLLGRTHSRARTILPLLRLQEITLERTGESPAFTAGLVALSAGTLAGTRFISEGLLAPGGAPWLIGTGALLLLSGVLLDFFVGSGRTPKRFSGPPQLVLKLTDERGWVLSKLDPEQAEALLAAVEKALASGGPLPEQLFHPESRGAAPLAPVPNSDPQTLEAPSPPG